MAEHHEIMGGKVHVYRRKNSTKWQCATYLNGRNWRKSTGEDSLAHAKDFAEDWYFELRGKHRAGVLKVGKTFLEAAEQFLREYEVITEGERSRRYVELLALKIRVHLIPFFGEMIVTDVTPGAVQNYRVHRMTSKVSEITGEAIRPARSTIHHEIIAIRHVLKTANRHGWLPFLPDLSAPYKTSGKIAHRAWFTPEEYKQLYEATRRRAQKPLKQRWKWECEQMHDYVLFMANTGLRPDEAANLQHRDVSVLTDEATGEEILEIEVRGKRGVGYCKSMPGAVRPYQRLQRRSVPERSSDEGLPVNNDAHEAGPKQEIRYPQTTDRLFPRSQRELFNSILDEEGLKFDRDGNRRTAYSLRHTYICLRLMEGADIYQIAKNCRTSVEMIEKHYAIHLKNTIDAAAVNVRRIRPVNPAKPITPQDARPPRKLRLRPPTAIRL